MGTDNKYFIKESQKCETCYGVPDIVTENDPKKVDDNEYKCTPCTDQGANYYFDTNEKKCKTCVDGIVADDGKTCTACEGTVSLDFKTCNPCDKAGKNELWDKDTKTCKQCIGTINSTTCQGCESHEFFN